MKSVIASSARDLSRRVFASLPFEARLAAVLPQIIKLAFGDDETTLGLSILYALDKANVTGEILSTGKTIQDLKPELQKGNLARLSKIADHLANIVLKKSKINRMSPQVRAQAIDDVILKLNEGVIQDGVSVAMAMTYISQAIYLAGSNSYKTEHYRGLKRIEITEEDVQFFMGHPSKLHNIPHSVWNQVVHEVQRNPLFKDDKGQNRAVAWITGILDGLNMREIAAGMDLSPQYFMKWMSEGRRMKALQEALLPLLNYIHS